MVGWFDTVFGGGAEKEAAQKDIFAAQNYANQANPLFQQAYQTGVGNINQGIGGYAPLAQLGKTLGAAAPQEMAALGIGTPAQTAAARSAFEKSPGFQEQLSNAAQAVARQRAVGGMGASGNANLDQYLAAAGITAPAYQQYLQNLQGAAGLGANAMQAAASGQMGGYTNLANLGEMNASNQAGVLGNVAQTTIGANNLQAAGEAAGAKNLLNAGMSLATLAAGGNPFGGSLSGGGGGGGGFGSSLLGQGVNALRNSFMGGGSITGY